MIRVRAALAVVLTGLAGSAFAQSRAPSQTVEKASELANAIGALLSSVTGGARGKLLDFFETVEVWDAEAEIDRLIGNPWDLHDSTQYKLRLLPLRLAYPVYGRLSDQMTALDDRRGIRIQNIGPDSVDSSAVTFDALAADLKPRDFARGLLGQFSVREFADLGTFVLSHQPFFPQTDEGWQHLRHRMAKGKLELALGVFSLGSIFNAGAFSYSHRIAGSPTGYRLGWYGGVRHVGYDLQPQFRGGLTAVGSGLEMAVGLSERIRPSDTDRRRSLELALREGWLSRLTRPSGWDAFLEAALRQVIAAEPGYGGEDRTGRLGIFARREGTRQLRGFVFRTSAELETDFTDSARFVSGIGLEHTGTGLSTLLQTSRTAILRDGSVVRESRGGLFVAGTVERPTRFAIDAMHADARAVHEEWDALNATGAPVADAELHLARMAFALADYLETRRRAYSLLHWTRPPNDLYGPLDAQVLIDARRVLVTHFGALSSFLRELSGRMAANEKRTEELTAIIARETSSPAIADAYRAELEVLERIRRREAERVGEALLAYHHFRNSLARMAATGSVVSSVGLDLLDPFKLRALTSFSALPLH